MTELTRLQGLCVAVSALLLAPLIADADSHDCPPPETSIFDQAKAQELFQNRANPEYWVLEPTCELDATYDVVDADGTPHANQDFPVGANPGDEGWLYRAVSGSSALLTLKDYLPSPLEEGYSSATTAVTLWTVEEEYTSRSPEAVSTIKQYFTEPGGTHELRKQANRNASEAINTLLALPGVSVTCDTLQSRPKFKEPICSSVTGGFDLRACQFNYNASVAVRKRGIVRVVWYTLGYGGQHDHARESRRFECDVTNDREDLESWFSRSAFRQLCRREDYDIPYQTQPSVC